MFVAKVSQRLFLFLAVVLWVPPCNNDKIIVATANLQRAGPHSLSDSNATTHIMRLKTKIGMPTQHTAHTPNGMAH
jgi:hypothetical protein